MIFLEMEHQQIVLGDLCKCVVYLGSNSLFPIANESSKSSMHNNDLVIVNISRKLNYYQSKSRSITHKKFSKQNAVLGREKPTQFYT